MKKYALRVLSVALLFAFLLAFCACGENKAKDKLPKDTVTASADTTADPNAITTYLEPLNPAISELDYGDATVTVLTRGGGEKKDNDWLTVEELENEPVNDAIYNRTIYVEELLNVNIKEVGHSAGVSVGGSVRNAVSSGDSLYDIVADSVYDGPPLISEGLYLNLCDNGIETYLDITKPWWSQKWIDKCMMGDRLYCITGSLALSLKRLVYAVYYNKTIGDAHGIENLYDVVSEGRWTVDYMNELVKGLYVDMNGNSEVDEEDSFGLITNSYDCVDMYWSAFDLTLFAKDEDGWFVMDNDVEKQNLAIDKIYSLLLENKGVGDMGGSSLSSTACTMFSNGQSLLCTMHLKWAEDSRMRNMTDEYGIIPEPKFDEDQKEYYTYAHDQYSVLFVPANAKNPEMSGAVLEALCYESYKNVDPAYYDLTLKGRYANDPETRKMLDLVMDGFVVDAAWVYGKEMGEPAAKLLRVPIDNGNKGAFTTNYAKYSRSIPVSLRAMKKTIEALPY